MNRIIVLSGLLLAGCVMTKDTPEIQISSTSGEQIILRRLSYQDGILEGELFNRSERTAQAVTVEVSFLDSTGKTVFSREFVAVPGGDGRALMPQYAKHFNYKLALDARSRRIAVSGKIKSVRYK